MSLLDDLAKGASPAGLATGIGVVLLTPVLVPAVTRILRPVAKEVMRTGITVYRGVMEPVSGAVSDLVAEAQLELATASTGAAPRVGGAEEGEAGEPEHQEHHRRRGRAKRS
ncbi:MAG TPA: hypothetical protein VFN77_03305 [Acetobacteraceae bacterium]|nr:hypothetical protein [Acetobacteraceae bacterium]